MGAWLSSYGAFWEGRAGGEREPLLRQQAGGQQGLVCARQVGGAVHLLKKSRLGDMRVHLGQDM